MFNYMQVQNLKYIYTFLPFTVGYLMRTVELSFYNTTLRKSVFC